MVCGMVPLLSMEEPPDHRPRESTREPAEQEDSPASQRVRPNNGGIPISLLVTREEIDHHRSEYHYDPGVLHNAAFAGDFERVRILLGRGALTAGDCTALDLLRDRVIKELFSFYLLMELK